MEVILHKRPRVDGEGKLEGEGGGASGQDISIWAERYLQTLIPLVCTDV